MIQVDIPGYKNLFLEHLVLDFNGTLAVDGYMVPVVKDFLNELGEHLDVHIITADTFGRINHEIEGLHCTLSLLGSENQAKEKQKYVQKLGSKKTIAIGNGRNDRLMVKEAELGIATIQKEGAAVATIEAADIVVTDILSALNLLKNPLRLIATLRS